MVGTAPELMASRNDCVRLANIGPVSVMDPNCFGPALARTYVVNLSNPARNSGRSWFICIQYTRIQIEHQRHKLTTNY